MVCYLFIYLMLNRNKGGIKDWQGLKGAHLHRGHRGRQGEPFHLSLLGEENNKLIEKVGRCSTFRVDK